MENSDGWPANPPIGQTLLTFILKQKIGTAIFSAHPLWVIPALPTAFYCHHLYGNELLCPGPGRSVPNRFPDPRANQHEDENAHKRTTEGPREEDQWIAITHT
jgi:hypothetical protein